MSTLKVNNIQPASGDSVTVTGINLAGTNIVSSSAQIGSDISGSFTSTSSSLASRISTAETELGNTLVSSSAQIASDISGSFTSTSSSLASRISTAESELGNTLLSSSAQIASDISGSFTSTSSSLASRISTAESELGNTLLSSSAQIASQISGSFTTTSSSLASRISTAETELGNTLVSSSAQIASDISGSFTAASSSLASRISTAESELGNTLFSASAQVDGASITNNTVTIGDSAIALNGTDTTLTGLTDIDMTSGDKTILDGIGSNTLTIGAGGTTVVIAGDLTVSGTNTTLNTANLLVEDKLISVASGSSSSSDADGAGLHVSGANATFTYSHSGTKWNMNKPLDMDDNTITTTGAIAAATLNTGQGANELYAMDQDVQTSDSPQFDGVNIGHASDTTITRASAGDINVEGNLVYRAGGTDVPVADGGTGASTLTDGGVLLGSGTSAITAMAVLSDGEMIVGDGSGDPVAESGATLRTSIGVGLGDNVQFSAISGSTVTASGNISGSGLLKISGTGTSEFTSHLKAHCLGVGTNPSGTTGEIRATNDITAYYSSDERLKENIIELDNALDKVNNLRGVSFDWKTLSDEEKTTIHSHEGHDIGVIAQEVKEQYPELVEERDNGYLAVDYKKLTAVLIQAVKELSEKVDKLNK